MLGSAQDGGYPQAGCKRRCCLEAWRDITLKRMIASLAIISEDEYWLIDITPDFRDQIKMIASHVNEESRLSGIFITHAHIGHYMGLLALGLEVMNTSSVPIYVMPRMKKFLENNAPFSQLIKFQNIKLISLNDKKYLVTEILYRCI